MALIKCPECGAEISDKAKTCPRCGYPIQQEDGKAPQNGKDLPRTESDSEEIISCPECGKDVSKQALTCPSCGCTMNGAKQEDAGNIPQKKNLKPKVIVLALVVVAVIAGLLISSQKLTPDEELALTNCEKLVSMLKNPDSFTLYEDVIVCDRKGFDDVPAKFVYITYGGSNSYGAMIKSTAIFRNEEYVGEYGDDEDDFDSLEEYDDYLSASFPYAYAQAGGKVNGFKYIDADMIMKKIH